MSIRTGGRCLGAFWALNFLVFPVIIIIIIIIIIICSLERDHLGDPGVDRKIILRWFFRKWDVGA
jgi:hypothetical protein